MSTARLHHDLHGPEDAPALVFGPSLGTDLGLFDAQVAALSGEYRVIRFDLRGHGGSEVPPGPYTIGALAEDVIALLDSLAVDRFSYCGVSIGGAIGQWLGIHHGDRMDGLIICASAARFADPEGWPVRAAKVRAEGTEFLVPSRTGAWFTAEFAEREPAEAQRLLAMLRSTPAEGYAGCCEAIGAYDVRDRLRDIAVPTLVIAGEEDPATPPDMCREIADGIPGARFRIVPGASHLLNAEKPEIANPAIAEHLAAARSGTRSG
ncbi:3-oxoadipate enol-lactonase [Pseudonocardia alni]|uniref:3-oxoadipate enol-lactonase n=1 Tax=Pseudonocardia alni TaxID=33907 RepID=UPI0036972AAE